MNKEIEGILLVHKPRGITSHDVVDIVRSRLGIQRVGHAGTLDPLAEGLLIMLVGRATKLFNRFVHFDKEYMGVMKMGEVTETGDSQGKVIKNAPYEHITAECIRRVFEEFLGEQDQIPPMVSALRVKGKRLYDLARKGIVIDRQPRKIRIHSIDIRSIEPPLVEFYVRCSKGTYIRKLAEDVGEKLGCGAHMVHIKRLSVGPFTLADAVSPDAINESNLRRAPF